MARIDAPFLNILDIRFYLQLEFDTPRLAQFINRTPHLKAHDEARVVFSDSGATVSLPRALDDRGLELGISCQQRDWQLSSLAQVCGSCFHQAVISAVEHLYIFGRGFARQEDDIESSQWLELLHPFTAVKNLYLSKEFEPGVVHALQGLSGHGAREVLPSLQYLHLEAPPICSSPRSHQVISSHCRAPAIQSPCNSFSLGPSTTSCRRPVTDISDFYFLSNLGLVSSTSALPFFLTLIELINWLSPESSVTS